MTVDSAPEWICTSDIDKKAKEAFTVLNTSNDKVVIPMEDQKSNRFILKSRGYFDLQAYVLTGKDFPNTNEAFQKTITKAAFQKLTNIDSDIYEETQRTMVGVGATCAEYHQNHMTKLVTAAAAAIKYSENTVEMLQDAPEINLKHQLNILLDPKYKSEADWDEAYKQAKESAKVTLGILKSQADEKGAEVKTILETLLRFRVDTISNLKNINHLKKQYKDGPAENPANMTRPYLTYLNEELTESVKKLEQAIRDADDKYGDWEKATGIAIGTAFLGVLGLIVMSVAAAKAKSFRDAYENLMEQVRNLQNDNKGQLDLISFVTQLITQCVDIGGKMDKAITAMAELHGLFSAQSSCFDKISEYLGMTNTGTDVKSLPARKAYIDYSVKNAGLKLKELKEVAQEFERSVVFKATEKLVNSLLPPDKQVKFEELWKLVDQKQTAKV